MQRDFELKLRDMNEEISKQLDAFIKEQGMTRNSFALKINVNSSNFSRKMNGKIKFTDNDFLKIHKLTGLSPTWLKTGEGEKYSGAGVEALGESNAITSKPFYDVDFALGFATMYNDTPNVPNKYVSVPGYEKADFWCRTSGDSMQPVINGGDMIALKEVLDWQDFLPMNEVYAIMTTNDLRTVKVVRKCSDDMRLTLHAYNEEYEDQEISKASIAKVFKVLGVLKTL